MSFSKGTALAHQFRPAASARRDVRRLSRNPGAPGANNRPKRNRGGRNPLRRRPKASRIPARRTRSLVRSIRTTAVRKALSHASPRINPIATISAIRSKIAKAAAVGGATNKRQSPAATNASRKRPASPTATATFATPFTATRPSTRRAALNAGAAPTKRRSPKPPFRSRRSSRNNPT